MPKFGRWISRDPIGERGGLNLFNYVSSKPIAFRDPYGLLSDLVLITAWASRAARTAPLPHHTVYYYFPTQIKFLLNLLHLRTLTAIRLIGVKSARASEKPKANRLLLWTTCAFLPN